MVVRSVVSNRLLEDLLSGPLTFVHDSFIHSLIHCSLSPALFYEVTKTED